MLSYSIFIMNRSSQIFRKTNETEIASDLNIDGVEKLIDTPIRFLNHMLDLFSKQGLFDLNIKPKAMYLLTTPHS